MVGLGALVAAGHSIDTILDWPFAHTRFAIESMVMYRSALVDMFLPGKKGKRKTSSTDSRGRAKKRSDEETMAEMATFLRSAGVRPT